MSLIKALTHRLERLHHTLDSLQQEWKQRHGKLTQLRKALAIEVDAATKFKLEQQIQDEDTQLKVLDQKSQQLEAEIEQVNQESAIAQAQVYDTTLENPVLPPAARTSLSLSAYDAATWVGRDSLITALTQKLQSGCRILALTGITGIGKTALAERVVVDVHQDNIPFHRLNFDDRGQRRNFINGALSLLLKLKEPITISDQQSPQNALQHLLQTLRYKRFLIQIDSLERLLQKDELNEWNTFIDPLWVDFFQQILAGELCQSQLILTTQALPEELEVIGSCYPKWWHRQDVGGLLEKEQLQLFEKNGVSSDAIRVDILKQIGKSYEGHPLVIQVIAKDILDKPFNGNVQHYWRRYQEEFNEIERECDQRQETSSRTLKLRVKYRVEQSLQRLPTDAYKMLCRSAVYRRSVPEEFWIAMLEEFPKDKQWKALVILKSHNLAEEELRGDGLLLLKQHNLIRSVAKGLLKKGEDQEVWKSAERIAARVWLQNYESEADAPNLKKMRGKVEAFYHYREVEDWERAKRILIDEKLGKQLDTWGYYQEVLPLYNRLLGKLDASVDIVCQRRIGNTYWSLSNYPKAIEHYLQSFKVAREIGYRKGEGKALGNLGYAYHSLGDYSKAIEYHQQHLVIANEIGDQWGKGAALGGLGNAYISLGNYPQAIELFQQDLISTREIGDRRGEGYAFEGLGDAYFSLDNYHQAIECHHQHLVIAREIGDRQGEGRAQSNLGKVMLKFEQYPEAQNHLQKALELCKELGVRVGEAKALLRLGELYYRIGQPDLAWEYCDRALAIATELGIPLVKECEALQALLIADTR